MDPKKNTKTTVQTRTLTERVTRTLTREEELVVRMTRGLGEGPEYALEFRGGTHPETSAQLALIEAAILAEVYEVGPLVAQGSVDNDLKGRIIDKLSKLGD